MNIYLQQIWEWRLSIIFIITPLVLLPLPLVYPLPEAQVAYVMLIMGVYWVTEALPIAVTALIPVVAMPALKILSSKDICPSYFEDSNMLFIGGLMLAISVEYWNLHTRIALTVLQYVGVKPRWLLLGFMLPTWFMSMWISNTATSAMMLPIVDAILQQLMLHDQRLKRRAEMANHDAVEMSDSGVNRSENGDEKDDENSDENNDDTSDITTALEYIKLPENQDFAKICKMLTISVAYSANIGGTATLTGTAPNLVLNNNVETSIPGSPFNFLTWMLYALPISLVCVILAWVWLQILYLGPRNFFRCSSSDQSETDAVRNTIRKEYEKIGSITFPEVSCIIVFAITVILWFSRQLPRIGWGELFSSLAASNGTNIGPGLANSSSSSSGNSTTPEAARKYFMADAQPAIIMSLLLFVLPSRNPFKRRVSKVDVVVEEAEIDEDGNAVVVRRVETEFVKDDRPMTLLNWKVVHERLPWGIVLLLGGGFALAKSTQVSGLSTLIGAQLSPLGNVHVLVLTIIVVYCTSFVTEITSNTATASILLPILINLSKEIKVNPLALMLPCTVACSLAFNLPVATPPNSIVFSKGYLTVTDMIKSGFPLTIVCGIVVVAGTLLHGSAIFSLSEYPEWAP